MFGQVVIGPPGSGKSTYCKAMQELLRALKRPVALINLDPANDQVPYDCDIDVQSAVSLQDVMCSKSLGPNGGLLYCMEWLVTNLEWLRQRFDALEDQDTYFIIDLAGQVELFTHNGALKEILKSLQKWGHRLVTVNLIDSHYCTDVSKFVSVLLTTLNCMLQLETPHLNILSKMDLIQTYGELPFNLEYFTEVLDLRHLLELLDKDPFTEKHNKLNAAICEVIQSYNLVSFQPLNINDKESMMAVLQAADLANGFCYSGSEGLDLRDIEHNAKGPDARLVEKAHERYCS